MAKSEIIVGDKTFKTKKSLKECTSALLKKRGVCKISKDDADYAFFFGLYSRKPSHLIYIQDVDSFEINWNPITKNKTDNLSCILKNGNAYVFSWNKCCDGVDGKSLNKLKEACRTSVRSQIKEKWCNTFKCYMCENIKTNEESFEVDHKTEFCKLFNDFMSQNSIEVPTEFNSNNTSQHTFKKDNEAFERSFQTYHQNNAELQLLCCNCHRQKTSLFLTKN